MEPKVPAEVPPPETGDDPKLVELRPKFATLIRLVLADLRACGFQAKIHNAYRSAAKQQEKYDKGYSQTAKPGAHHWGLAVDIIDRRWGWQVSDENAEFFLSLRAACDRYGIANGGWWGLKPDKERGAWLKWKLGWDPAHCFYWKPPDEWKQEYRPPQNNSD